MLSAYQQQFAEFNIALTQEHYLHFSGQKKNYNITPIYDRYSDLFTLDNINSLQAKHDAIDEYFATDRLALRRLITFTSQNYLRLKVKELTEEIANMEATTTLLWQGGEVTLRQVPLLLANEGEAKERRELYRRYCESIDTLQSLRQERIEKLHQLTDKLFNKTYLEFYRDLQQFDYLALDQQLQQFCADTEELYTLNLGQALMQNQRICLADAHSADTFAFLRLKEFDPLFPPHYLISAYRETMAGLGINIDRQSNVHLDLEMRVRKQAKAFCAPIIIPQQIKLVLSPLGGLPDYQTFFHEVGPCQHAAFTSADLRPEFKYTGDYALTAGYAFLFNYLVADLLWLQQMLHRDDLQPLRGALLLAKLYNIRRNAGKLHYEIYLHRELALRESAEVYADSLTRATVFHCQPVEYLSDLDEGFYSANYLRAGMFEILLREYLMTHYGRKWWSCRKAGDLLKELWYTGNRYTMDELVKQLGLGELSMAPLTAELLAELHY